MRRHAIRMAVGLLVLIAGADLFAQRVGPVFSLSPAYDSPRGHAPIQLIANLSWPSMDLLAGRLELEFYVNQRLVHTWVSREVVLSGNEVSLPFMTPPALLASERDLLSARARFVGEQQTYDLEIHDVPYPVNNRRALTIGIVHPETAGMPPSDFTTPFQDRFAWVQPFRLDATLPHADWARHLSSRAMVVEPDLVPDEPLELVAFDLLIVTGAGLSDLGDQQLVALAQWVEAGGALCVAGEQARSVVHQRFLNRIAGSSPAEPIIEFDADGNIRSLRKEKLSWLLSAPGVGRAMVTFSPVDVQTPAWRRDILELWRVRPPQMEHILADGSWEFPLEHEFMLLSPDFRPMRPDTGQVGAGLQSQLIPDRVEGVPLPTVAILLTACLLAVGPGDYLLLGWLRRRRWTWVLFPSIAIGFAIFMVQLATSHMGQTDHRTALSVVDLTRDGRPARISRFELLFAASEKQIEEELTQTLVVPIDSRPSPVAPGHGVREPATIPTSAGTPGVVVGRAPRGYTHVRSLRQWTPRLARYTTMSPGDDTIVPEFDWWRLEPETLRDAAQRNNVLNELQRRMPEAQIVLMHKTESWRPGRIPYGAEDADTADELDTGSGLPFGFALEISARPPEGMFHIVSQIAPNAAGNFEDLTLFDRDDPRQWLLLIVTTDDAGNHHLYRRLIRDDTP